MTQLTVRIGYALALYAGWTLATWYFEGRIQTLLRPEALLDRIVYAVIVNLVGALIGSTMLLRWLDRRYGPLPPQPSGFGSPRHAIAWTIVAALLGIAYLLQQLPRTIDPVVLVNGFSQVFVVSTAEVTVCWSLVARTVHDALKVRMPRLAGVVAAIAAAALFGAYHIAHSAPFNSPTMVALLMAVGLVTSLFFFASRDVFATAVFHNFLGTFGVLRSLETSGRAAAFERLQPSLILTAAIAALCLVAAYSWLRRSKPTERLPR